MTRLIPLAFLTLSIAACSPADIIEGKPSAFEQYQERLAALEMRVAAAPVAQAVAAVEPVLPVVDPEPVEPPCQPVFRVVICDE